MSRFFRSRYPTISIGAVAAGVFGVPFPMDCLLGPAEQQVIEVDWDAELQALLDS